MPKSRAEAKMALAVISGKAKNSGMSMGYAREVVHELHARGKGAMKALPEHAKKTAVALLLACAIAHVAFAQTPNAGAIVRPNPFPSGDGKTIKLDFDGSGNTIYVGVADGVQNPTVWARTPVGGQLTLTSIVVSGGTATVTVVGTHGLDTDATATVAGSAVAALNAAYTITSTGASTFTFTTAAADATYNNAALQISSTAPRSNAGVWAISKQYFNGSNQLTDVKNAGGVAGNYRNAWSSRTTLSYQ